MHSFVTLFASLALLAQHNNKLLWHKKVESFATTSFKKGGRPIFKGGAIFER